MKDTQSTSVIRITLIEQDNFLKNHHHYQNELVKNTNVIRFWENSFHQIIMKKINFIATFFFFDYS